MYSALILTMVVDYLINKRTGNINNVITDHMISGIEAHQMDVGVFTPRNRDYIIQKRRNINLMNDKDLGQMCLHIFTSLHGKSISVFLQTPRTFYRYDNFKPFYGDELLSKVEYRKPIQSKDSNQNIAKRSAKQFYCFYCVVSKYIKMYAKLLKSLSQQQYIKTCYCTEITDDKVMELEDKEAAKKDDGERVVEAAEQIEGKKVRKEETADEMIKRNAELKSAYTVIEKQEPLTFKQKMNSIWQIVRGNEKRKPISDIANQMIKEEEAAKSKSKKGNKDEGEKPAEEEKEKPDEEEKEKPAEEEKEKPAEEEKEKPAGEEKEKPGGEEKETSAGDADEPKEDTQTPEAAENPGTPAAA